MARMLAGQMPNPVRPFFYGRTLKARKIPAFFAASQFNPPVILFRLQWLNGVPPLGATKAHLCKKLTHIRLGRLVLGRWGMRSLRDGCQRSTDVRVFCGRSVG